MIMLIPYLSCAPDKPEVGPVHSRGSTTGKPPGGIGGRLDPPPSAQRRTVSVLL